MSQQVPIRKQYKTNKDKKALAKHRREIRECIKNCRDAGMHDIADDIEKNANWNFGNTKEELALELAKLDNAISYLKAMKSLVDTSDETSYEYRFHEWLISKGCELLELIINSIKLKSIHLEFP
jgi:hypothetical protein